VPLPSAVDIAAEYGAVQVSERAEAAAFIEWLGSGDATEVLRTAGFEVDLP
jgi:hypothetical protein